MQIIIDTREPLNEEDQRVLKALLNGSWPTVEAPSVPAKASPPPAKKAAPKAEPEPEPVKAVTSDDLKKQAMDVAAQLLSDGRSSDVKAALETVGVQRVRELAGDQIQKFLEAVQ